MDAVVFEFALMGAGWFDVRFCVGVAALEARLGDSPDPLEELMNAALALACDEDPPHHLLWDPEDGKEYRWNLSRRNDHLHVRVAYVDANTSWMRAGRANWPGTVFDADCQVSAFCSAVTDRAAEVLARYGLERYEELSLAPFPTDLLHALQVAVAQMSV